MGGTQLLIKLSEGEVIAKGLDTTGNVWLNLKTGTELS